jgi:hypothetical protein
VKLKTNFPICFFDYAGIIPSEGEDSRYFPTPNNTTILARTGGDGVHFSVLEISGKINPVVMTVPMNFGNSAKDYNIILGENLNEFMGLGYHNGWFYLEQICYKYDWAIKFYSNTSRKEGYLSDGDFQFVKKLVNKLCLTHYTINPIRIKELNDTYFDKLIFKQEFIDKL